MARRSNAARRDASAARRREGIHSQPLARSARGELVRGEATDGARRKAAREQLGVQDLGEHLEAVDQAGAGTAEVRGAVDRIDLAGADGGELRPARARREER